MQLESKRSSVGNFSPFRFACSIKSSAVLADLREKYLLLDAKNGKYEKLSRSLILKSDERWYNSHLTIRVMGKFSSFEKKK